MKARMRFLIILISLIFILSVISLNESSVGAIDSSVNASLAPGVDGKSVTLSTSVRIPGSHSSTRSSGSNPKNVGPLVWKASMGRIGIEDSRGVITYATRVACNPNTFAIIADSSLSEVPEFGNGIVYQGNLTNRSSGAVVKRYFYCKGPRVASTRIPQGIPTPPTYEEIWRALYSQAFLDSASSSGAYVAPSSPGLTGLPTHIWSQFEGGQRIDRDVVLPNGYRLQANAHISEVTLSIVDSQSQGTTLATLLPSESGLIKAGSFEQPHVQYVFRSAGNYMIRSGIIWTANNATLIAPDGSMIGNMFVPVGSVRLEINRDYAVKQLKPALTK